MAREAHSLEWRTKIEPDIRPGMSREQFKTAIREAAPKAQCGRDAEQVEQVSLAVILATPA